ncbi:hypothetical protein P171DRAFT_436735 [Karstenula rhodostoma CBS 690.94]|uniref:Uncharacterized protein n=1 Tax=Karstenula rhodostoma CBS 690.94 TaxID=1392251 RepID=A0A9P4P7H8_9PLEO|nr:hypothetical protein P171DRAFT_436735 [Karstenula rhodostoma CBS 690.94]
MADKSPAPKEEAHAKETGTRPKESYEDYIKALPPPFWATKKPPSYPSTSSTPTTRVQDRSEQEIAASINAVCAPITAADRAEDTRRSSRSLRERWKDWKSDKEKRKSEADIRPMEKGSSARLNVWGSPITDKGRFKK